MKVVGRRQIAESLADWGLREWHWRLNRAAPSDAESGLVGVNTALWYRAPYVWRILHAQPDEYALQLELDWEDSRRLHIADGRRLEAWTDAILVSKDDVWVRDRVPDPTPVSGPLICTGRVKEGNLNPPVVIFDGWHRAAVWVAHGRAGNRYAIGVDLIVAVDVPPLTGNLQP
jgi:hypothetical protein